MNVNVLMDTSRKIKSVNHVTSDVRLVKMPTTTVPLVLITDLENQIVLIAQLTTSMMESMLIANFVKTTTINVLNVTPVNVPLVNHTESPHTVLVNQVTLKEVMENVYCVLITVLPVLILNKIVYLVFLQESTHHLVSAQMVSMMMEPQTPTVHNVTTDAPLVKLLITTVLNVPSTDTTNQNVHVSMVWPKLMEFVNLADIDVSLASMMLTIVLNVFPQELIPQPVTVLKVCMKEPIKCVTNVISFVPPVPLLLSVSPVEETEPTFQIVLAQLELMKPTLKTVQLVTINVIPVNHNLITVLIVLLTENKNQPVTVQPDIITLKDKPNVHNVTQIVPLVLPTQITV